MKALSGKKKFKQIGTVIFIKVPPKDKDLIQHFKEMLKKDLEDYMDEMGRQMFGGRKQRIK